MPVKIFQLHKRSSYKYANIQDKFAFNEESKLIAIADGTTQSFRSDLWASILTKEFVSKPQFSAEAYLNNIGDSLAKFNAVDFVFSENPALASLEKQKIASGATTTFMGLKFEADAVEILSCGDSNVFILKDNEDIDTYPFNSMDELDNNKSFINTIKYTDLTKEEFYYTKLAISHNDKLIICTDALSRFLLENKNYLQQILQFKTHYEFYQFCIAQWDAKKMQEDDITLVIVEDPANFKTGTFIPAKDFEFEKEKEYEFIPTPINDNDMNDNNNNLIEALRKELHEINGKINKLESIFKFLLIITVVNLAFNFYVSYNSLSTISDKLKEQLKYRTITDPLGTPEKPNKQLPPKELATPPPPPTQPAASTPTATTPPKAPSANNVTAAPVQFAPAKNNPAAPVAAKPAAPAKPATKALPTAAKPAAPAKTVTPAAPAATTKPPSL